MAKAYSDDLRRKILEAHAEKEGTIAEMAMRFRVSVGYVKKILRHYRRTQKMERTPHRPGRKPKFTLPIRQQIRADRKSTRLNSSHTVISYAVFCLKKKTNKHSKTQ